MAKGRFKKTDNDFSVIQGMINRAVSGVSTTTERSSNFVTHYDAVAGSASVTGGIPGTPGTVITFSFNDSNGFFGTVINNSTYPELTLGTNITGLLKGNGTSLLAAVAGTDYVSVTGIEAITGQKTFTSVTYLEGINVTYSKGGNTFFSSVTGNGINYNQATAVFTTATTGSPTNVVDTAPYVDITNTYNTSTTCNITNGGSQYNRFYIGYDQGVPRTLFYYATTTGIGGTITWERWNGSAWATITVSNLTADGSTAITTTTTSKTTINGVNAYWIRGTVATAYSRAPLFRFGISNGFSNMTQPWSGAAIFLGKANLPTSVLNNIKGNNKSPVIALVTGGNGEQDVLTAYSEYTGAVIGTLDGGLSLNTPNADNTFRLLTLNGGTGNFAATLRMINNNRSLSAWGANGCYLQSLAGTVTDSSTATSGTAALATFHSFAQPALAATNSSVTTTDAATVYIAGGPTAGTNQTITNSWALYLGGNLKVNGTLVLGGGVRVKSPVTVTTTYSILATDYIVNCDTTSAGFTVTLPTAIGRSGQTFIVKKKSSDSNTLTVNTTGGQTIDTAASVSSNAVNFPSWTFVSDGANWWLY